MSWGSWSDFVAMGGYGLYVWGSYAVTAGLLAAEVLLLRVRRRNALNQLGLMNNDRSASQRAREAA